MSWGLALHGGAGDIAKCDPEPYRAALAACLDRGVAVLTGKASPSFSPYQHLNVAMQSVIETVMALEDCELFNAGRGAVLNCEAEFEMDSQVMDNRGHCGACTGLRRIRNPVLAAERIMTETKHALVTGPSAEQFAVKQGVRTEPFEYFRTDKRWRQIQAARGTGSVSLDHNIHLGSSADGLGDSGDRGTVGAVAKDADGNIACAVSTGGMTNKMVGRVGDSPIVGGGCYAGDKGGVCATGKGETFLYHNTCGRICAAMDYGDLSLPQACAAEIGRLEVGDGGVIGVDSSGTVTFEFNSLGMLRAMQESSGRRGVGVWKEWEEKNF